MSISYARRRRAAKEMLIRADVRKSKGVRFCGARSYIDDGEFRVLSCHLKREHNGDHLDHGYEWGSLGEEPRKATT